jgi:predicted metal-dependent hydrolase
MWMVMVMEDEGKRAQENEDKHHVVVLVVVAVVDEWIIGRVSSVLGSRHLGWESGEGRPKTR